MILRTNIWGIRNNPELLTFLQTYKTLYLPGETSKGVQAVEYDFGIQDHEALINSTELAMLLDIESNVWIKSATIFSTQVGDWRMDQDVPEDFPRSTITEDDVTRQRTWREYAQHFPVDGGYLIKFTTRRDENNNASLPSDSLLRLYLREFTTYLTKAAGLNRIIAYNDAQE